MITISVVNYSQIFIMTTVKEKDYDGKLKILSKQYNAEVQGSRSRSKKS